MADYQYIGWGQDDGLIIGKSGESIGFFGTTPATQATVTSTAITATPYSISSVAGAAEMYGFQTVAQAQALLECVRQIRAALVAHGLLVEG